MENLWNVFELYVWKNVFTFIGVCYVGSEIVIPTLKRLGSWVVKKLPGASE